MARAEGEPRLAIFNKDLSDHAVWAIGASEFCPTTHRQHLNYVFKLAENPVLSYLTAISHSIHIETIPDHEEKRIRRAITYATTNNYLEFQLGPVPDPNPPRTALTHRSEMGSDNRPRRGKTASGNSTGFPREYVDKLTHLEMIAMRVAFAGRQLEPLEEEDLINKNLFVWGDPGTGKTYWAHTLCGEFPILKGQNKWWDGTFSEVPPTGIL
jgi:hypothetical protein